jgi:hypothetical protein
MVDRESLIRTTIAGVGALLLVVITIFAAGAGGTSAGGAQIVVAGIAVFILYLTVAGYWLSAR